MSVIVKLVMPMTFIFIAEEREGAYLRQLRWEGREKTEKYSKTKRSYALPFTTDPK